MRAFLGINYIMSTNELPAIKSYWDYGLFVGDKCIRNVMARLKFEDILQNLHFWTTKWQKDDKKMTKVTKATKSDRLSSILIRFLVILLQIMILKALTGIWWTLKINQAWNNTSKTSKSNGVSSFSIAVLVKQDTFINLSCLWAKRKAKKKIWDLVLFWIWLNFFKIVTLFWGVFLIIFSKVLLL